MLNLRHIHTDQLNNNANISVENLPSIAKESEVTKSPPSVGCEEKNLSGEVKKYEHVSSDLCDTDLLVRHQAEGSECTGETTLCIGEEITADHIKAPSPVQGQPRVKSFACSPSFDPNLNILNFTWCYN